MVDSPNFHDLSDTSLPFDAMHVLPRDDRDIFDRASISATLSESG